MKPPSSRRLPQLASKPSAVADSWSFLEQIDAPQWVDLSLESSMMGAEGHDPWFDRRHRHHVISLSEKQANHVKMNGLPSNSICHVGRKSRVTDARERKKFDLKDKTSLQKVTSSPHNEDIYRNFSTYRRSTGDSSQSSHSGSQDGYSELSRISNRTSISSSFAKYGRRCSERSSNGCSSLGGSVGSNKLQFDGSKHSSCEKTDDSLHTPSDGSNEVGKRTSGFSIGLIRPKLRFSFQRRTSLLTNSQATHVPPDKQSPGSSVLTDESTGSCELEKENASNDVNKDSKARTGKLGITITERTTVARRFGKDVKADVSKLLVKDPIGSKRNMLPSRQTTKEVISSEVRIRNKIAENKKFSVLSNKQVFPGKENKISKIASPAYLSNVKKNTLKVTSVRSNLKGNTARPISLEENLSSAKSKCVSMSTTVDGRKRIGTKHSAAGFCEKTNKCDKELEDIVAKHNQKIRALQVHALRKQFR